MYTFTSLIAFVVTVGLLPAVAFILAARKVLQRSKQHDEWRGE